MLKYCTFILANVTQLYYNNNIEVQQITKDKGKGENKMAEGLRRQLKEALNTYQATTAALEEIEALQEAAPENEALDKEWDEAYKNHFNAYQKAAELIQRFANVDAGTARMMVAKHTERLLQIV